ncbi:hypothetical protein TNCV_404961 [Trichonephila clavipes]|nr:hypothetical protein TNCV_404961 [Trichonephila clavipes]
MSSTRRAEGLMQAKYVEAQTSSRWCEELVQKATGDNSNAGITGREDGKFRIRFLTSPDNMLTKYQMIKFIDFCVVWFQPESVARVAAIVGDHHCHSLGIDSKGL